jgi:Glyoxalase-like domain
VANKGLIILLLLLLALAGRLGALSRASVIGNGWGLDHVIVGAASVEVVKDLFGSELGFTPLRGNKNPVAGLDQAIIPLPDGAPAYVELVWPYQEAARDARPVAALVRRKLELGGGPVAYNIAVSSANQAADALQSLGFRVTLPPSPVRRTPDGKEVSVPAQMVDIDSSDKEGRPLGVPGGAGVGFVEYKILNPDKKPERVLERVEREVPDPRRAKGEFHANTARRLRSVWVAVPSAAEAIKQAGQFGFTARGELDLKTLGEKGVEVQCGQGTIVFFEPAHEKSPLAAVVAKKGLGPLGISIGVADLKTAQRIVQEGTHSSFEIQRLGKRTSLVVPAELAAGMFIEFVQE